MIKDKSVNQIYPKKNWNKRKREKIINEETAIEYEQRNKKMRRHQCPNEIVNDENPSPTQTHLNSQTKSHICHDNDPVSLLFIHRNVKVGLVRNLRQKEKELSKTVGLKVKMTERGGANAKITSG